MSTLGDILGIHKITIGGNLDFSQMQLDRAAKGLRMLVDDQGDLVAFPVVVMDPTAKKVAASQVPANVLNTWVRGVALTTNAIQTLFAAEPGVKHYWMGGVISSESAYQLAAGQMVLALMDGGGHVFDLVYWIGVAADRGPRSPIVLNFPGKGILLTNDMACRLDADLAGGAFNVWMWGVTE